MEEPSPLLQLPENDEAVRLMNYCESGFLLNRHDPCRATNRSFNQLSCPTPVSVTEIDRPDQSHPFWLEDEPAG